MSETGSVGGLFTRLPAAQAHALQARGSQVHYPARRTIFATGEPGDTMLVIATGRVEISLTSEAGRRSILAQLGPGDVVGEMAVLDGAARSADVVAASDVTGRLLTRAQVMGFLAEAPEAAIAVIEALCQRLRQTNETLADHVLIDGKTRLARLLLRLFESWGAGQADGSVRLDTGFSQTDLGDMAGLTRESVNRLIRIWEAEGRMIRDGGALVCPDLDGLRDLAG